MPHTGCPANYAEVRAYYQREKLWALIPFLGPSLQAKHQFSIKTATKYLENLSNKILEYQHDWRTVVDQLFKEYSEDFKELLDLIPELVQAVDDKVLYPISTHTWLNTIALVLIAIVAVLVVYAMPTTYSDPRLSQ